MKNIYIVITPKELHVKTIAPSGKSYTCSRIAQLYFCMISVNASDPMIMYTEQKSQAVYYTEKEIKVVERYLINNKITFSIAPVNARNTPKVQELTIVNQSVNTSIVEFV